MAMVYLVERTDVDVVEMDMVEEACTLAITEDLGVVEVEPEQAESSRTALPQEILMLPRRLTTSQRRLPPTPNAVRVPERRPVWGAQNHACVPGRGDHRGVIVTRCDRYPACC